MPMTGKVALSSNVTRIMVCVDGFGGAELSGRLISQYLPKEIRFVSMMEFINELDAVFDGFSFPQQAFSPRQFTPDTQNKKTIDPKEVRRYMDDKTFMEQSGTKSTFIVQVQFRQNATWQGTIQWIDKKMTQKFRSTLELIKLMDDALGEEKLPDEEKLGRWE